MGSDGGAAEVGGGGGIEAVEVGLSSGEWGSGC